MIYYFDSTQETMLSTESPWAWRVRWSGHDALYLAAGPFRLRIMKRHIPYA